MNTVRFSIGIAGPSCSGKGTIARALASRCAEDFSESPQRVVVLSQDAYYVDLSALPMEDRAFRNFDEPAAFDWPLMERQLHDLLECRVIDRPVYDFAAHTRREECQKAGPADIVIFEGLLALHSAAIRDMLDVRVYLEASGAVCLERRIERDIHRRGRTRESVERQFRDTVQPMAERWVHPQRAFADLVVDGEGGVATNVAAILEVIDEGRSTP